MEHACLCADDAFIDDDKQFDLIKNYREERHLQLGIALFEASKTLKKGVEKPEKDLTV
jgi:hypothetical protein